MGLYLFNKIQKKYTMNNFLLKVTTALIMLATTLLYAQDFQGKAIYQSKTSFNVDMSKSGMPPEMVKRIQSRMKSMGENTFILNFNKSASIYKKEEKLDDMTSGGGRGMRFAMMGGFSQGKYYRNTASKTYAQATEMSGKNFLIKDSLNDFEWKMEEGTKQIGNYLCFKATTVRMERERNSSFRFGRGRNNDTDEEKDKEPEEPKMVPVIYTAWYTLDIPVSHGPGNYWGLPGLILEVSGGNTTVLCTKIVLNPKDKIDISEPKKGKEVTQAEYDKIMEEQMEKMRERFEGGRQRGQGTHRIRIGG
jgi:GLPGLI family protein